MIKPSHSEKLTTSLAYRGSYSHLSPKINNILEICRRHKPLDRYNLLIQNETKNRTKFSFKEYSLTLYSLSKILLSCEFPIKEEILNYFAKIFPLLVKTYNEQDINIESLLQVLNTMSRVYSAMPRTLWPEPAYPFVIDLLASTFLKNYLQLTNFHHNIEKSIHYLSRFSRIFSVLKINGNKKFKKLCCQNIQVISKSINKLLYSKKFSYNEGTQLYSAFCCLTATQKLCGKKNFPLPNNVLSTCRIQNIGTISKKFNIQKHISDLLTEVLYERKSSLELIYELRVFNIYPIDISLCKLDDRGNIKILAYIEVHGSCFHFIDPKFQYSNGMTLLKETLLKHSGIPYLSFLIKKETPDKKFDQQIKSKFSAFLDTHFSKPKIKPKALHKTIRPKHDRYIHIKLLTLTIILNTLALLYLFLYSPTYLFTYEKPIS